MSTPEGRKERHVVIGPWHMTLFEIGVVGLWVVTIGATHHKQPTWVKNRCLSWQGNEEPMREQFETQKRLLSEVVALRAMGLQ